MTSETLARFYREYYDWVQAGANRHHAFDRQNGLCSNLNVWAHFYGFDNVKLDGEQETLFVAAGLDPAFPFDDEFENYANDKNKTLNPRRMAWVRDHMEQAL